MQDRMEESRRRREYTPEEIERIERREMELISLREHIQEQEKQLDEYRSRLKQDQLAREKEIQKELEQRERFFYEREKKLTERQKEYEKNYLARQTEIEELKSHLTQQIVHRENELLKLRDEVEREKERYNEENRKKIERTSTDYVSEALELLSKKEAEFHSRSKAWAAIGAGALVAGVLFFGYVTITSFSVIPNPVSWEFITFVIFKGLIAVILFAALAKYSLVFSNSYMREALKNADRRHAINFGKFYLESYGASADWSQIKEAFEHWNISGENAFSKASDTSIDVTSIDKIASVLEKIGKYVPATSKEKGA